MGYQPRAFSNLGYLIVDVPEEALASVKLEIDEIQANFASAVNLNHTLAGNIEHEYELKKSVEAIDNIVKPAIFAYGNAFNYGVDPNIKLRQPWVNFQKKYEFNPLHSHSGEFAFVIWTKVPYRMADELSSAAVRNSNYKVAGHFYFVYSDSLGRTNIETIPADQSYENKLMIFPASMLHGVYPFYTSDEYRISLSGNYFVQ